MNEITREYKGLAYNDDFTVCYGFNKSEFKKVTLHPNTRIIEYNAFENSKIEEVICNEKLTVIKDEAFYKSHIQKINFPTSLKSIGYGAFANSSLEIIDLSKCTNLELNSASFKSTHSIKLTLPNTLKIIPAQCFYENDFSELTLPDSLKTIDYFAFAYCPIETLDLKNVVTIDEGVFRHNKILNEVKFNESIKEIKASAFSGCISLTKTNLSKTKLEILSKGVFNGCIELKEILLPSTLKMLQDNCLNKTKIEAIMLPESAKVVETLDSFKKIEVIKQTLDDLLNEGKSFKEINNLYNKLQER